MNIAENVVEIFILLEQYFIYLYPGFITAVVSSFIAAKQMKYDKLLICKSVVISYVYILLYEAVMCYENINQFTSFDYILIFALSIFIPIIIYRIASLRFVVYILNKIGIESTIEDTALEYIANLDRRKRGIILKIYLDETEIMYEGYLRYYVPDPDREQIICLNCYRKYKKIENKYIRDEDYGKDQESWVMIKVKDVTRMEIRYLSKSDLDQIRKNEETSDE